MASSTTIRTSDVTQEVVIRMGKEGIAASSPQTVMEVWDKAVKERGNLPALHHKVVKKVRLALSCDSTNDVGTGIEAL
jgi:hypothetical protein